MRTRIISAASLIAATVFLIPLAAQAIMYAPGQTLNPACAPTDPNCGVVSNVAAGTAGQVPYYAVNGNLLSPSSGFTILQNGNVGIGTSTPAYALDVNGTINAGQPQSGGPRNVGLSVSSGQFFITNDGNASNLFIGDVVGKNTTGSIGYFNTIVGLQSGANIPDVGANVGHSNSFFGHAAGAANTTGTGNNYFGDLAGTANTTGLHNVVVGSNGGQFATGSDNTLLGAFAGTFGGVSLTSLTTGSGNTILGKAAGGVSTGSNNIIIGINTFAASSTASNQLDIQNIIYGTNNASTDTTVSTGQVGIGTPLPQGRLDVAGTSNLTTLNTFDGNRALSIINTDTTPNNASGFDFRTNDANGLLTTGAKIMGVYTSHAANAVSGDLAFLTRNAGTVGEAMRITSDGKIGIGTPNPALNLDGTFGVSLEGSGGAASYTVTDYRNSPSGGNVTLNHARGTQSVPLPIVKNDLAGAIFFQGVESDGVMRLQGSIQSSYLANNQGALTFNVNNTPDNIMSLATNSAGVVPTGVGIGYTVGQVASSTASLSINGKVGIGTSTPNALFQIVQSPLSNPGSVSNSAGGTTVTGVGTDFTNTFKVGDSITILGNTPVVIAAIASNTSMTTAAITNATTNVAYGLTVSGATRFSVLGNGNVGIGTTSPAQKLDVTGTIRQAGCITAGTLSANTAGDIICTPSSLRFKDNIQSVGAGLSEIVQLRPVSYHFKPELDMGSSTRYGFIAEEVASVTPEFATYDAKGAPYGLDTNAILAAAVNAIKELDLKVNGGVPTAIAQSVSNVGQAANSLVSSGFDFVISQFNTVLGVVWENGGLKVANVISDKLTAKELCLDDVCINKDQLKEILATATTTESTTTTVVPPEASSTPLLPNTGALDTPPTPVFERTLDIGSSGPDVTALQILLMQKGFLFMPSTMTLGYFGEITRTAVMQYQASVGLAPLGTVGPATRAKLNAELGR